MQTTPENKIWLEADWPAPDWIHAGTTTRIGGTSQSPYETFNLALHVGDNKNNVLTNRQKLIEHLGLKTEPCWLKQEHSNNVITVQKDVSEPVADGAFTSAAEITCAVLTADCLPVLLCDRTGTTVAAVHVGWRGFSKNIIVHALDKFKKTGNEPIAWLGPCISAEHYEIDTVVYHAASTVFPGAEKCFTGTRQGHWLMDLKQLAKLQLNYLNVEHVYISPYCTYTDSAYFYSHRRDGTTGRMASMIWMDSHSDMDYARL